MVADIFLGGFGSVDLANNGSATTSLETWYPARDSNPNLNVRSVLS